MFRFAKAAPVKFAQYKEEKENMFCVSCQNVKAESGCYLSGIENRVCLACYVAAAGSMPLPASAPPALGGAFAAGKIAEYRQRAESNVREKMNRFSETVAAEAAGFEEVIDQTCGEVREKKEAFWREMPQEAQDFRSKFNSKRVEIRGEILDRVDQVKEQIADQLSRFNPLDLL